MKKSKLIIVLVIVVIMFIPLIGEMIENQKPKGINYDEFKTVIENKESGIVYINKKGSPLNNSILKSLNKVSTSEEVKYFYIEYETLSDEQRIEMVGLSDQILELPTYIYLKDGNIEAVRNGGYSETELKILTNKYYNEGTGDVNYRVAGSADDFIIEANKDKTIMVVLGRNSCTYCELFKPIYNELAPQYDIDIYYFDSDSYNSSEYSKVLRMDYTILGLSNSEKKSCTESGKDEKTSSGFSTPTTLFIKDGKTVDCILGSRTKEELEKIFKENKITKKSESKPADKKESKK